MTKKNQQMLKFNLVRTMKGFSLIEALISIFLFALAMTMLSGVFANFLRNFSADKKMQKDIENAQFAMNIIAKTVRTSALSSGSKITTNSFPLNIFDFSQSKCIQYNYVASGGAGKIQMSTTTDPSPAQFSDCHFDAAHITGTSDLTTVDIFAKSINAISSDNTVTPATRGLVTMELTIKEVNQSGNGVPIEMTVSLRQ